MKTAFTLALAAASLAATDAAAQSHAIKQVCLSYDKQTQELVASLRTRCLGSGARETTNTLALEVNPERALIAISGTYETRRTFHIGTADCMATQSFDLTASQVDQRRYSFVFDDRGLGVFDATQSDTEKQCYALTALRSETRLAQREFEGWAMLEDHELWGMSAPQVSDIVAAMIGAEPETLEGKPETDIKIERIRWMPSIVPKPVGPSEQGHDALAIRLTRHGLLDDSVSGERITAILRPAENGWKVNLLYGQIMCARGANAGQWTAERCP